jgi:hypothetical protein
LLWTGPRRVVSLFYFKRSSARRVARHRTSSVMRASGPTTSAVRQRRSPGAVLRIPMDGWHTYAWMLEGSDMAFLDARSVDPLSAEQAVSRPILFRVGVHKYAYSTGRWQKIGAAPLPKHLRGLAPKFLQDTITGKLEISGDGGVTRRPASLAECEHLERMASWDANHVEDRLRDHYAGVPNKWVESLRPRGSHA